MPNDKGTINNSTSTMDSGDSAGEYARPPPEFGGSENILLCAPPGFESLTTGLEEDLIPVAIPPFPDPWGRGIEIAGELESLEQVQVPDWIEEKGLKISFTQRAINDLEKVPISSNLKSKNCLKEAIMDVLQEDPRSNYRRDKCTDKLYFFTVDNVKVTCWFDEDLAEVLKISQIE